MTRPTQISPGDVEIVEQAKTVAAEVFGVTPLALLGRQRSGPASDARAAFALALHTQGVVWPAIGLALARAHSGPRAAVQSLKREAYGHDGSEGDAELRLKVEEVLRRMDRWARSRSGVAAA